MAATYKSQIMRWDWMGILRDSAANAREHIEDEARARSLHELLGDAYEGCDDDGHVGYVYLGSVMNIYPSGKYYMPWTTNQTADDVDRDSRFGEALEAVASKHDGWVESGEGDPTDLYFARYWSNDDLNVDA